MRIIPFFFFFSIPRVKTWISFLGLTITTKPPSPFTGRPYFKTYDSVIRGSHSTIMIVKILIKAQRLSRFWVERHCRKGNSRLTRRKKNAWFSHGITVKSFFFTDSECIFHIPSPCILDLLWHNTRHLASTLKIFILAWCTIVTTLARL